MSLNPNIIRAVDHDFGYLGIPKQLLEGAAPEQVVRNELGRLVLDSLVFLGKDRGAAYIYQRSIPEYIVAVGCLIDKDILFLQIVGTLSYDFR